jgi:hypothetical protein
VSVEVASSLQRAEGEAALSAWFASLTDAYLCCALSEAQAQLLRQLRDYLMLTQPPHKGRSNELLATLRKLRAELLQQAVAVQKMLTAMEENSEQSTETIC